MTEEKRQRAEMQLKDILGRLEKIKDELADLAMDEEEHEYPDLFEALETLDDVMDCMYEAIDAVL